VARHRCLAVCPPGVEELTAGELGIIGVRLRRTFPGGVEFAATDRQLYAANLWLRTATRVVVRVATFVAHTFEDLDAGLAGVAWDRWMVAGSRPAVRVSSTASRLYHTGAIADRVAESVSGGAPSSGDSTDAPLVVVRLIHDRAMVSVDSSGAPLHQRGWRQDQATAPLRETLAAAVVLASGWDRQRALVDPMCGSGTIAIEAALLAAGLPPGRGRRFGFESWPSFQPGTWASVIGEATAVGCGSGAGPAIVASDRDPKAVAAATANAERAGVAERVTVQRAALSALEPPGDGPGWLVTNPPYGKRSGAGADRRDLYARLGQVVRRRLRGWTVALLVDDVRMSGHAGLRLTERLRTVNGGIPVRLMVGRVGPHSAGQELPTENA
jgi:putative N6-adenine-specific DNA methylase